LIPVNQYVAVTAQGGPSTANAFILVNQYVAVTAQGGPSTANAFSNFQTHNEIGMFQLPVPTFSKR
jgi:hypothetical protein